MAGATLDHIVVDTRDRIDEAAATYTALGFQLTPRGHHTLGSSNNLAIFGTNYLELLGFGDSGAARPELMDYPIGLNGVVFKTDDAEVTAARAQQAGIPATPARAFSRPVELDGATEQARFRTTHLPPETSGIGRVYFCEHLTPELVWRPEWQVHPNGAQEILRVLVATEDATRQTSMFGALFQSGDVSTQSDGGALLALSGGCQIVMASVADTLTGLGDAAPDPAGRGSFLAAMVLRVASASAVARLLRDVPGLIVTARTVTVPARAAFNTALVFEEAHAG